MLRKLIKPIFLHAGLCLLSLTYMPTGTLMAAEDDVAALKKQVDELKKENTVLRQENLELRRELRELKNASDGSKPSGEPADAIVGKIWEIVGTDNSGKRYGPFRFLAHDGNIYIGDLKKPRIGYYTEKGPNVRVDVTDAPSPAGNGVYNLIQFSKSPPTYRGRMTNTSGHTLRIELRILED